MDLSRFALPAVVGTHGENSHVNWLERQLAERGARGRALLLQVFFSAVTKLAINNVIKINLI